MRSFAALNWDAVSLSARPKSKTSLRPFSGKPKDTLDEIQTKFLSQVGIKMFLQNVFVSPYMYIDI